MLEKYSLPLHWQPPSASLRLGRLWQVVFKTLCICAYGEPNLESLWASIRLAEDGDDTFWEEEQKRACEQQSNILVLVRPRGLFDNRACQLTPAKAGLLLATAAVFITTPPPDACLLNYTSRGPYLCICGSFGILVGGIIVTSIARCLVR